MLVLFVSGCTNRFTHANRRCPDHPKSRVARAPEDNPVLSVPQNESDPAVLNWFHRYSQRRLDRTPLRDSDSEITPQHINATNLDSENQPQRARKRLQPCDPAENDNTLSGVSWLAQSPPPHRPASWSLSSPPLAAKRHQPSGQIGLKVTSACPERDFTKRVRTCKPLDFQAAKYLPHSVAITASSVSANILPAKSAELKSQKGFPGMPGIEPLNTPLPSMSCHPVTTVCAPSGKKHDTVESTDKLSITKLDPAPLLRASLDSSLQTCGTPAFEQEAISPALQEDHQDRLMGALALVQLAHSV